MKDPDFFAPGEPLKASKLNQLVTAIREKSARQSPDPFGEARIYRPFDPISIDWDSSAEKWRIILKPSWIINGITTEEISVEIEEDLVALSDFPEFEVEEDCNLYLDVAAAKLSWHAAGEQGGKLLVLEVVKVEDEVAEEEEPEVNFEFINKHPSVVVNAAQPLFASVQNIGTTEDPDFVVSVSEGFLISQNIGQEGGDGPVRNYVPKMNDTPLNEEPDPLSLSGAEAYVYLHVETSAKGIPDEEAITIEAFSSPQTSTHHDPVNGEDGDYYFLLLSTTDSDGVPTVNERIAGNRYLPNQLVELANVGGKREVYVGYKGGAEDKHEFRSLEQLENRGEAIIKPLDPGDAEADPPVPPGEEGDTIPFKTIAGRVTQPQVRVTADGDDIVQIEGNSYDAEESNVKKFSIEVKDGLVTSLLKNTSVEGWWGTISLYSSATGASTQTLQLTFEDGDLVTVVGTAGEVEGTEDTPGSASLSFTDT